MRSAFNPFILSLSICLIACDPIVAVDVSDVEEMHREGGQLAAPGEVFGPCLHDSNYTYHWCSPSQFTDRPVVCSVPQVFGAPHATVCYERRETCPEFKLFADSEGNLIEQPLVQDYALACALECTLDTNCPEPNGNAMICVAGVCAWETFDPGPNVTNPCCVCSPDLSCVHYEDPQTETCPVGYSATLSVCV